jgi:hypothetical protein
MSILWVGDCAQLLLRCLARASLSRIYAAFNSSRTKLIMAKIMASMMNDDDDDYDDE